MTTETPKIDFAALMTHLVTYLEGFSIDENTLDNGWGTLEHPDGRKLGIRYDAYEGKLRIWGKYGLDARGRSISPKSIGIAEYGRKGPDEINVSPHRTPEAIAKDIKRRLLPAYSEYFLQVSERVTQERAKNTIVNQRIAVIAASLGSKDVRGDVDTRKIVHFQIGTSSGSIDTYNGDTYTLEIRHISHTVALKIAEVVREEQAKALLQSLAVP